MSLIHSIPPFLAMLIFIICAWLIGVFGIRMTHVARTLARQTGLGEALMGAVFIGASTSLSGIVTSMTAAVNGYAELAVSNALGGIAAQTLFLAIADIFYRRANLEHAAASAENLMTGAFLMTLLAIVSLAMVTPDISLFNIHPLSLLLIFAYGFGVRLLARTHAMPMWLPVNTRDTRKETSVTQTRKFKIWNPLWLRFGFYAIMVGVSGWILSLTGIIIVQTTGLSEGIVGGVFTAVITSLPELVIAISAVRMGSLTLAVGDIIGGNTFDTLFISISDMSYGEGSIYPHISQEEHIWLAISMLMTGVLLMGLLNRERHGIANIGWESFLLFIIYTCGVILIAL